MIQDEELLTSESSDDELTPEKTEIKLIMTPSRPKQKAVKAKPKKQLQPTKKMSSSVSPKKKQKLKIKDLKPLNLEQEKQLFFQFNYRYQPQFEYIEKQIKPQQPHFKYRDVALKILNACIKQFGSEEEYLENDGGRILSMEETQFYFDEYIQSLDVGDLISYEFQNNTVAPTSVVHNPTDLKSRVIIGLPIQYRSNRIQGVLNHEIGTHFIRKLNDRLQVWYKKRNKFQMQNYLKVEEGLAVVNQVSTQQYPYMYMGALHYISAIMASQMGFVEMFQELERYIKDPERRFRECLRMKRGIKNTGQPGGMFKDQVYLIGAIKVLKNRHKINFIGLHSGKITVKDSMRLADKINFNIKLPKFLDDMNQYMKNLERIAKTNLLER